MASPSMPLPRRMKSPVGYAALGAEPVSRRQTSRWVIAFAVVGTLIGAAIIGVTVSSLVTTDSARDQSRATRTAFETALYGKGHTAAGKSLGGRRATGPAAVKAARSETTNGDGIVNVIDNMATVIGELKMTADTLSSAVVAPGDDEEGESSSLYAMVSGISDSVGTSDTTIMDELAKIGSPDDNGATDPVTLFGNLNSLKTTVGAIDISGITGAIGSAENNGATNTVTLFGKLDSIETTTRPNDHGVYATYANSIGVVKSADGDKVRSYVTKLFGDDEKLKVTLTTQSDWDGMSNIGTDQKKCEYTSTSVVDGVQILDEETFDNCNNIFDSNERLYVHVSRDIGIENMYEPVLPPLSPCNEGVRISPKSFDYYKHAISAFSASYPTDEFSDWSAGTSYADLISAMLHVPGKSYTVTLSAKEDSGITGNDVVSSYTTTTSTTLDFTNGENVEFTFNGGFSTSNFFDDNREISVKVECDDCASTIHGEVLVNGEIELPQPPIKAKTGVVEPTKAVHSNTLDDDIMVRQLVENIRGGSDTTYPYNELTLFMVSDDIDDGGVVEVATISTGTSIAAYVNTPVFVDLIALRSKLMKTSTAHLRVLKVGGSTKSLDFEDAKIKMTLPYDVKDVVTNGWHNLALTSTLADVFGFSATNENYKIAFIQADGSTVDAEIECHCGDGGCSYGQLDSGGTSFTPFTSIVISDTAVSTALGPWDKSAFKIVHVDTNPPSAGNANVEMGVFTLPPASSPPPSASPPTTSPP